MPSNTSFPYFSSSSSIPKHSPSVNPTTTSAAFDLDTTSMEARWRAVRAKMDDPAWGSITITDRDEEKPEKFPMFDAQRWGREGGAAEKGVDAVWARFWQEVTFHLSREDFLKGWVDEVDEARKAEEKRARERVRALKRSIKEAKEKALEKMRGKGKEKGKEGREDGAGGGGARKRIRREGQWEKELRAAMQEER